MSHYKTVESDNYSALHTDHSAEIQAMRDFALSIVAKYPDGASTAPHLEFLEATVCMAAAGLLEVHDDSGISLDNWTGPRELVETGLMIVGLPRETFLENHV